MLAGQWERRHGQLSLLPLRVSSGVPSLIRRQGNFRQRLSQHEPSNDSLAFLYLNPLCLAFPIPMNLMRPGALGYALIIICLWPPKVAAAIVNATIDDQRGDSVTGRQVIYYPAPTVWDDQTCGWMCLISPNASQAFDRTYTAVYYIPPVDNVTLVGRGISAAPIGISMEFTGRIHKIFFVLMT